MIIPHLNKFGNQVNIFYNSSITYNIFQDSLVGKNYQENINSKYIKYNYFIKVHYILNRFYRKIDISFLDYLNNIIKSIALSNIPLLILYHLHKININNYLALNM